ncbi:MAG: hypothetical protein RR704_15345 [Stenotrophomonas sp.]
MRNRLCLTSMLALLFVATSACAQTPMLTPEKSFDLFARFLLEGDAEAAAQVSAMFDMPPRSERWEATVERMMVGEAPEDNAQTRLGRELSPILAEALRQTRCRSTGSARSDRDGIQVAMVDYSCQMPDYAALADRTFSPLLREQVAHDNILVMIRVWMDLLQRAPKRTYTAQVTMARAGEQDPWGPQDLPQMHEWIQMLLTLPDPSASAGHGPALPEAAPNR